MTNCICRWPSATHGRSCGLASEEAHRRLVGRARKNDVVINGAVRRQGARPPPWRRRSIGAVASAAGSGDVPSSVGSVQHALLAGRCATIVGREDQLHVSQVQWRFCSHSRRWSPPMALSIGGFGASSLLAAAAAIAGVAVGVAATARLDLHQARCLLLHGAANTTERSGQRRRAGLRGIEGAATISRHGRGTMAQGLSIQRCEKAVFLLLLLLLLLLRCR